jgi:hypothetical protein
VSTDVSDAQIGTSPDGVNWTYTAAPASHGWWSTAYGNGRVVSVGTIGVSQRVMTLEWASQMAVNAGNSQSAAAGSAVATAPSVIVRDANNNPVANVGVTFAVVSGGGTITGATAVTDVNGIATVGSWTLGAAAGANTLTATVDGLAGSPVTFSATSTPPPVVPELVTDPVPPVPPSSVPPTRTLPPATSTVPVPVPDGGVLPSLVPGVSQVLVDGVPESVEVLVEASTDLVVRGQDFELRLAGECSAGCTIETTSDGRQVLTLEERGVANVSGEGFLAGTPVYVWLFSEPMFLGELTVNPDGTFTGSVALGDIAPGAHTLQVNGTASDGKARTVNLGVVVTASGVSLPAAGFDVGVLVLVAMLVVVGVALVAVTRRRPVYRTSN